jgi:hypothetical protein
MFTADTPFAKVFAIVRHQVIAIFTEPEAGATDHFIRLEAAGSLPTDPNGAPLRKL